MSNETTQANRFQQIYDHQQGTEHHYYHRLCAVAVMRNNAHHPLTGEWHWKTSYATEMEATLLSQTCEGCAQPLSDAGVDEINTFKECLIDGTWFIAPIGGHLICLACRERIAARDAQIALERRLLALPPRIKRLRRDDHTTLIYGRVFVWEKTKLEKYVEHVTRIIRSDPQEAEAWLDEMEQAVTRLAQQQGKETSNNGMDL